MTDTTRAAAAAEPPETDVIGPDTNYLVAMGREAKTAAHTTCPPAPMHSLWSKDSCLPPCPTYQLTWLYVAAHRFS